MRIKHLLSIEFWFVNKIKTHSFGFYLVVEFKIKQFTTLQYQSVRLIPWLLREKTFQNSPCELMGKMG